MWFNLLIYKCMYRCKFMYSIYKCLTLYIEAWFWFFYYCLCYSRADSANCQVDFVLTAIVVEIKIKQGSLED